MQSIILYIPHLFVLLWFLLPPGPTVADLAASQQWAKEFATEEATASSRNKWASEFLDHPSQFNTVPDLPQVQQTPWAKEFLEQSEHQLWYSILT